MSRRSIRARSRRCVPNSARSTDTQPTEQLDALLQKRQSLINVLQRRLDAGELTYARYLATSQQVFAAALDNLREIGVAVREHQHDRRDLHRPTTGRTRRRRQRSASGRTGTGDARTPPRPALHTTPQDRPTARPERIGAHCARPHHDRPRRRADRQEAGRRRRGDGRARSARRPGRELCELTRRRALHESPTPASLTFEHELTEPDPLSKRTDA